MAPGFFQKIGDFAKTVGKAVGKAIPKVAQVVDKVIDVAAPVAQVVGDTLQSIPVPQLQGVGKGLSTAANVAQQGRDFLGPLLKLKDRNRQMATGF